MSENTHNIKNILRNIDLISEAISLKPDEIILKLGKKKSFKNFIEHLTPYIKNIENTEEWYDNEQLLALLTVVQNEINNKIKEKYMPKDDLVTNSNSSSDVIINNQDLICNTDQSVLIGIAIGFVIGIAVGKIYTKFKDPTQQIGSLKYSLLLIIPAYKAITFEVKQKINKDDASKLINHAKRAYCYAENELEGTKIAGNVKCADEPIDFNSDSSVFIHLTVSSSNKNITSERIRSNISDLISNTDPIKINKIAKLQSALSTKDFYDI